MGKKAAAGPAENSGENSGTALEKPPRGRPFKPGQSGNPGGRPRVAEQRARARDVHDLLLEELAERRKDLSFAELMQGLRDTRQVSGCKTPDEEVDIDVRRMAALGAVLANQQLSDGNRVAIITNYNDRIEEQDRALIEEP